MQTRYIRFAMVTGIVSVLGSVSPAHAQIAVSASYQGVVDTSLALSGMGRETGAHGWLLDIAYPVRRRFSVVARVDASLGRETSHAFGGTVTTSWMDSAYLGGVRFHGDLTSPVAPFLEILSGAYRMNGRDVYQTTRPMGPFDHTTTTVPINVGFGLNAMMTPRIGVRVGGEAQLDPFLVAMQSPDNTMFRGIVGFVYRFH